jgi:alpha-tubulin suppressor-like RCC1 family protein
MYPNYVFCWGGNFYGQLGDSSLVLDRSKPSLIYGHEAKDISVNGTQSCLIEQVTSDLFCWGNNFTGVLGSTNLAQINNPTLISSEISLKKISV